LLKHNEYDRLVRNARFENERRQSFATRAHPADELVLRYLSERFIP